MEEYHWIKIIIRKLLEIFNYTCRAQIRNIREVVWRIPRN